MEALLAALVYGSVIIAAVTIICADRIEFAILPVLIAIILTPMGFTARPDVFFLTFLEVLVVLFIPALLIRDPSNIWRKRILWPVILLLLFYVVRLLFDLTLTGESLIVYLRDIRIVVPFLAVVFLGEIFRLKLGLNRDFLIKVCAIAVAIDIVYFVFGRSIGVGPTGINAELLFRANVLRYQDDFSIVAFGFLNYVVFLSGRMPRRLFAVTLQIVIAALSLNRIFIVFAAFCSVFLLWDFAGRFISSRVVRASIFGAIFLLGLLAGEGYLRFMASTEGEVALRLLELMDWNLLLAGLQLRFVEPALAGGYELNWLTGLFGMGPSFQFFIPWFDYRGLDMSHVSVDSLFMYTFVKFGLMVPVLCVLIVRHCLWQGGHFLMNTWVWAYLLVHNGIGLASFLLFIFLSLVTKPLIEITVTDRSSFKTALEAVLTTRLGRLKASY